uniref:hydroxyacylglutathione hydrolase n=1 Tax=Parastrongyloides trichosuri TaxID=131310 RepID=A0A0N4ZPS5_PARTI
MIGAREFLKVVTIPQLSDNYAYLLICLKTMHAAVVDPVEYSDVVKYAKFHNVEKLDGVLITHHHWDHSSGSVAFADKETPLHTTVYGGGHRIKDVMEIVKDGDNIKIGNLNVKCLGTPCHTMDHICYYATSENYEEKAVFTGDTLFISGCGKFFEGTPEMMDEAINGKLASLPDDTLVYCGHEYTVKNLKFALSLEPMSDNLKKKLEKAQITCFKGGFTVPSSIGEEKKFNPFMRVRDNVMKNVTNMTEPVDVMKKLRDLKDAF